MKANFITPHNKTHPAVAALLQHLESHPAPVFHTTGSGQGLPNLSMRLPLQYQVRPMGLVRLFQSAISFFR